MENGRKCTEMLITQLEALFYASQKGYNKYELISGNFYKAPIHFMPVSVSLELPF